MIRVLLVDDEVLLREALRTILDLHDDFEVVGEAGNGNDAVREAVAVRPDVVLMDLRMPELDGIEATRRIVRLAPGCKVLMLTTFDADEHVYRALEAGASGFLLKDSPRARLLHALRTVADGEAVLDPGIMTRLVGQWAPRPSHPTDRRLGTLTAREREVLDMLVRGRSNSEIASEYAIAETTVKTHVGRILEKLDLRDRAQAVIYGYEHGLVTPGSR